MTDIKPRKEGYSRWEAVGLVWDIGISIAVPPVLCALVGRWLDTRYGTSPAFLISGFFISLLLIGFLVVRKGRRIAKRL